MRRFSFVFVPLLVIAQACGSSSESPNDAMAAGSAGVGGTGGTTKGGDTGGTGGMTKGDDAGGAGGTTADDETAPTITTLVPEDGAKGLTADTVITVTFSKPMDVSKVEAAYQSDDLPSEAVTFAWNAELTQLTITPNEPLSYAEGEDPAELEPLSYSFSIGAEAADQAGNPLKAATTVRFTTLRRISTALPNLSALTGYFRDGTSGNNLFVIAGDEGAASNLQFKGLVTFDIGDLPDDVVDFERAEMILTQTTVNGAPYDDLGTLSVHSVVFDGFNQSAFDAESLLQLSIANSPNLEEKKIDVREAMEADYAARADRDQPYSQYRIEFSTPTDGDGVADQARFSTDPTLELRYLLL